MCTSFEKFHISNFYSKLSNNFYRLRRMVMDIVVVRIISSLRNQWQFCYVSKRKVGLSILWAHGNRSHEILHVLFCNLKHCLNFQKYPMFSYVTYFMLHTANNWKKRTGCVFFFFVVCTSSFLIFPKYSRNIKLSYTLYCKFLRSEFIL